MDASYCIARSRKILLGAAILCLPGIALAGSLAITAPHAGDTFLPGDRVTISISQNDTPPKVTFNEGLFLLTSGMTPALGHRTISTGPYTLSFVIPGDARPGNYKISVVGKHSGQSAVFSVPVEIIVDAADTQKIEVAPRALYLPFSGTRKAIEVYGFNAAGQFTPPQSAVTYSVDAPAIVIVEPNGAITGVSPGTTTVRANYKTFTSDMVVTVGTPKTRGDFNDDGVIDSNDVSYLTRFINTAAVSTSDARDLNHDGKIDALDVRILTTLCTRPRCATQ